MKIAVVSDVIYPWVVGGGEKRYYEVFKRLAKKHDVHFYTMFYKGMPSEEFKYDGMNVHCVCESPANLYSKKRRKIAPAIEFSILLYRKLMKQRFDLIEANEFPFLPCFSAKRAARRQKIPLSITWHEVWGDYWHDYLGSVGRIGRLVERRVSRIPDKIISVSSSTTERLQKELGVDGKRIATINNGVDIGLANKIKVRREKNKVIFAGRLIPEKNVGLLVKKLPENLRLTVVGDGPEKERLRELANKLNKRVEFKPFIRDYEELLREVKSASLLVTFSEREGFSMTALEAVACGTPVLALRNSLPREIEELCYVTEENDAEESIQKYLGAKPKKQDIRKFDWDRIASRIEEIYKEMVG